MGEHHEHRAVDAVGVNREIELGAVGVAKIAITAIPRVT